MMKFPTDFRVGEVCRDQRDSRRYYLSNAVPKKCNTNAPNVNQVIQVDPREIIEVPKDSCCEPNEATEDVQIFEGNTEKVVKIGANLSPEL